MCINIGVIVISVKNAVLVTLCELHFTFDLSTPKPIISRIFPIPNLNSFIFELRCRQSNNAPLICLQHMALYKCVFDLIWINRQTNRRSWTWCQCTGVYWWRQDWACRLQAAQQRSLSPNHFLLPHQRTISLSELLPARPVFYIQPVDMWI